MFSHPRSELKTNPITSIRGGAVIPISGRRRKHFLRFRQKRPEIGDELVSAKTSLVRRIPLRSRLVRRPPLRLLAFVMGVIFFLASLSYLVA